MSLNLQEYWREIAETKESLDSEHPSGTLLVTQLCDKGRFIKEGARSVVTTTNAAKLLVNGTHRVSTEIERLDWERMQKVSGRFLNAHATDTFRLEGPRR